MRGDHWCSAIQQSLNRSTALTSVRHKDTHRHTFTLKSTVWPTPKGFIEVRVVQRQTFGKLDQRDPNQKKVS